MMNNLSLSKALLAGQVFFDPSCSFQIDNFKSVHILSKVQCPETRWAAPYKARALYAEQCRRVAPCGLQVELMFVQPRTVSFLCSNKLELTHVQLAVHLNSLHIFLKDVVSFSLSLSVLNGLQFFFQTISLLCQDESLTLSSGSPSQLRSSCIFYKRAIYLMAHVVREIFEESWTHNKHNTTPLG